MNTTTLEEYRIAYPRSAAVKTVTQSNMLRVLLHRRLEREERLALRNAKIRQFKQTLAAPFVQLWTWLSGRRNERILSPA